jgi:Sulfatase
MLLDVVVNVRYPAGEQALWYIIPALDVTVLLGVYAFFGLARVRVPAPVHIVAVALLVLARFIRVADGIVERYYNRSFDAYVDLVLLPELIRLLRTMLPAWQFRLLLPGVLLLTILLAAACYWALRRIAKFLFTTGQRAAFAGIAGAFCLASVFKPTFRYPWHYTGAFGSSVVPILAAQVQTVLRSPRHVAERTLVVRQVNERLHTIPTNLSRLEKSNVLLIFIESYGETVLERRVFKDRIAPVYDAMQADLGGRGFFMASSLLDSPTYGGFSWLAHATLETGVRVANQIDYDLLLGSDASCLARFFRDAGYRTVLVEPAVNRPWPQGNFYQFEQKYFAFNMDYQGPGFGYPTMPDQYLLDLVRRRELAKAARPLFVQMALLSSHTPWSHLPPVVDDWSRIGNGAIFRQLPMIRFPVTVSDLSKADVPYITSVLYVFAVLQEFLANFVADNSLVILLGDHQPQTQLTLGSLAHGVPVHVLSRNPAFVDAFIARGYRRGMWPGTGTRSSMDQFLTAFLQDFSSLQRGGSLRRLGMTQP